MDTRSVRFVFLVSFIAYIMIHVILPVRCGTDVDECSNAIACQNNGSCQNVNGTFSCDCPDQFIGDLCEISLTENCSTDPCLQGTCEMINTTHPISNIEVETFNCSCSVGYEGYKCATAIDYCSGFPCENGATCMSDADTQTFSCNCAQGYEGPTCDTNRDDCPPNHCQNNGVCVDGLNSYACNCTPSNFYTGTTCTEDINECMRAQPCQNTGLCLNAVGSPGFRCHCVDTGFTGLYCEQDIDECYTATTCKHNANCSNTIGGYDCNCTLGYQAKDCGIADCDLISCQNGGTCAVSGQSGLTEWNCHCPEYYDGDLCEIKGPCADKPCVADNTEQCSQTIIDNTFECHCKTGWQGTLCNSDVNECGNITLNLCENGATCNNNVGSYTCTCVTGYTDKYCQTDINECLLLPCKNDGYCVDGIGQFECNCTGTGFENVTCEVDIDECIVDNPCYNGASCNNNNGSFMCQCTNGYEGPKCEVKSRVLMEDDITWYIVGPVVALVLILITIGVVWFLLCVRTKRATRGAYSPSRQEVTGSRVELGNVLKKPPLERLI